MYHKYSVFCAQKDILHNVQDASRSEYRLLVSEVAVHLAVYIAYSTLADTFRRVQCIDHLAVADVDPYVRSVVEEYEVTRLWIGSRCTRRFLCSSSSRDILAVELFHELLRQS